MSYLILSAVNFTAINASELPYTFDSNYYGMEVATLSVLDKKTNTQITVYDGYDCTRTNYVRAIAQPLQKTEHHIASLTKFENGLTRIFSNQNSDKGADPFISKEKYQMLRNAIKKYKRHLK